MSRTVAFLTTFNRPSLLRRTLPRILEQLGDIPLVISDDHSTEPETLDLISEHKVIRPRRLKIDDDLHTHFRLGRNFFHGLKYIFKQHPGCQWVLKLDDDTWLGDDAIPDLVDVRDKAMENHDGLVMSVGGMFLTNAAPIGTRHRAVETRSGWNIHYVRATACPSPFVFHRAKVLRQLMKTEKNAIKRSWDTALYQGMADKFPDYRNYEAVPSLAYHLGGTGVHLIDRDLNRDMSDQYGFKGEHPKPQKGGKRRWRKQYGDRFLDIDGKSILTKGSK